MSNRKPVLLGAGVALVPLTKRLFAIIDEADISLVEPFAWRTQENPTSFYAARADGTKMVFMHRTIMTPPNDKWIDHANGFGLDNRRSNLRICTQSQNLANYPKKHSDNPGAGWSRFRGVFGDPRKPSPWRAAICFQRKRIHLGMFMTEEDAARAYDVAAVRYFGEFAQLNFPNEAAA